MPGTSSLRGCGMQVHGSYQDDPREEPSAQKMGETLIAMGKEVEPSSQAMVTTETGLAALPKKLVSKILANEYIDTMVLPPAKGNARNVPQFLEGQVLVVQAADLMQARKRIPDLAKWYVLPCMQPHYSPISPTG